MARKVVPSRHVALLRGINVGRAKRIAMADLRVVFEDLGFTAVRTLLNSGNVVFGADAKALRSAAARIEKAVAEQAGIASRVTVVRGDDWECIVAENTLVDVSDDPSRLLVAFPREPADRVRLAPFAKRKWGKDRFALGSLAAYLWCADGVLESELAAEVGRSLVDAVTMRNWSTVLKLHALVTATDAG